MIKILKKVFAFILSFAIIAAVAPSSAFIGFADKSVSNGFDGDFELLPTGAKPDNWTLKSTNNAGIYLETGTDYSNSYKIVTAEENGNKVLSVSKLGAGYIGATSNDIKVDSKTEYSVSLRYKQVKTELNGSVDFDTRLDIGEKNSKGIVTLTASSTGSKSKNWSDLSATFKTKEDTVAVVVYLWVGAQKNVEKTVLFDNVSILNKATGASPVSGYGLNLDFESGEVGSAAPCWSKTSFNIDGTHTSNGLVDYTRDYTLSIAADGALGNKSLAIKPRSSGTKGYVLAESDNISVSSSTAYSVKFSIKVSGTEKDKFLGTKVYIIQYDKNGKEITRKALSNSLISDTDWQSYDKYLLPMPKLYR